MVVISFETRGIPCKVNCSNEKYAAIVGLLKLEDSREKVLNTLVSQIKKNLGKWARCISEQGKSKTVLILFADFANTQEIEGKWQYRDSANQPPIPVDSWLKENDKAGFFLIPIVPRPNDCTQKNPYPKKEHYTPKSAEYTLPDEKGMPVVIITPNVTIDFL